MAFGGGGPHLCLGMHVARIEIAALLRELLTRCPDLAPAGEPERMASSFIAGVRHMPVALGRRRGSSFLNASEIGPLDPVERVAQLGGRP